MAYDEKYRERAIAYKESGHTFEGLKEVFGIAPWTYYNWKALVERTGSLKFVPVKTRRRKIDGERLKQAAAETPDAYLSEYARQFGCSAPAVFYAFKRLNITYKKTFTCREKPEEKRQEFFSRIAGIPAEKQVYADESGVRQALQRDYGRAVWRISGS